MKDNTSAMIAVIRETGERTAFLRQTKQVKVPRKAGAMRFTKCGTFRGFKYD